MDDWRNFLSTASHVPSADVAIERDAEALIERLQAFGTKVSSMDLSPRKVASSPGLMKNSLILQEDAEEPFPELFTLGHQFSASFKLPQEAKEETSQNGQTQDFHLYLVLTSLLIILKTESMEHVQDTWGSSEHTKMCQLVCLLVEIL